MISLSDFQTLSIAKINIFFINNQGFTYRYISAMSPNKLRCVTAQQFQGEDSQH